jgi:hypothetical protein
MSYGKSQNALNNVGSFRQISGKATQQLTQKKPKGGVPYFVDMYQPSTSDIDLVRLVPGEYIQDQLQGEGNDVTAVPQVMPFIKFVEHYDGAKKTGLICSAGPFANFKDKREPCHGCDIFWETAVRTPEGRLQSPRMSRQNKYAFSVFDYGVYHKMEQYDRDGRVKINQVTKEPYFNWVKCQGQGCDACRARKEAKTGDMRHWPMSYTQLQVLRSAETDIGKSCAACGTTDSIISHGWMCASCGECAIDMESTQLKKDEILRTTDNEYHCPCCNYRGFLVEVFECRVCSQRGQTGVRASLFDVDLRVKLIETPGQKGKVLQIMGWSSPHPVDTQYTSLVKPVDLVARYAPDSMERQAAKLGITNLPGPRREPQTSPNPSVPYGNR